MRFVGNAPPASQCHSPRSVDPRTGLCSCERCERERRQDLVVGEPRGEDAVHRGWVGLYEREEGER